MSNDTADQIINSGVAGADHLKIQTAEALEDAARRLRKADLSDKGEEVKHILHDVENRVSHFREEVGAEYHKMEARYHHSVEPVEHMIVEHPIPAVLVAAGLGVLIGFLICKARE